MRNHAPDIAAMDLFVVPTIGFDLIYASVIVRLDRRDLVWTNVTAANPTAEWVAPQIAEAFPWAGVPRHLIRDRIYDAVVTRRLRAMGSGIGPLHQPRLGRMALLCWQPTVRQQADYMRRWNRSGTKCENSLTPRSSILRGYIAASLIFSIRPPRVRRNKDGGFGAAARVEPFITSGALTNHQAIKGRIPMNRYVVMSTHRVGAARKSKHRDKMMLRPQHVWDMVQSRGSLKSWVRRKRIMVAAGTARELVRRLGPTARWSRPAAGRARSHHWRAPAVAVGGCPS
jgi:hypothetical protein